MNRVKVRNEVQIYEIDSTEVAVGAPERSMTVESHWNRDELVVLSFGQRRITVAANDLEKAIRNATNA